MINLELALACLTDNDVDFVIVGGVAITAHGSSYLTQDLDFCYSRKMDNLKRIVSALSPFDPKPRGLPENLPFIFDERTLLNATNFTFRTKIGDIDLLGEVAGVGTFEEVVRESDVKRLFDFDVLVLSLQALIAAKRAAGRAKDLLVLPELEALAELMNKEK